MEQNNPPLKKAYILTNPVFSIPYIIETTAKMLKINNVFTGFSFPSKKPSICTIIQIENNFKE